MILSARAVSLLRHFIVLKLSIPASFRPAENLNFFFFKQQRVEHSVFVEQSFMN